LSECALLQSVASAAYSSVYIVKSTQGSEGEMTGERDYM
jgi:hypothetical protein